MILEQLATEIKQLSEQMGYIFHMGSVRKINTTVREYPSLWLEFPKIKSFEGHEKGNLTYSVSVLLIHKADYRNNLTQVSTIEQDAIALYENLGLSKHIRETDDFECETQYYQYAPLSDVTAHVEFEVTMDFTIKTDDND